MLKKITVVILIVLNIIVLCFNSFGKEKTVWEEIQEQEELESYKSNYYFMSRTSIKEIAADLKNGKWEHGTLTPEEEKESSKFLVGNYRKLIEGGSLEDKATFLILLEYYYTLVVPYDAEYNCYGDDIDRYLKDNYSEFWGNKLMNSAISRSLSVMYGEDEMIKMSITDSKGCDIGGIISNHYWMNICNRSDMIRENVKFAHNSYYILETLTNDFYEETATVLVEYAKKDKNKIDYEIKGGPISKMYGHFEEWKGIKKEWVEKTTKSDLEDRYNKWYKWFNNDYDIGEKNVEKSI